MKLDPSKPVPYDVIDSQVLDYLGGIEPLKALVETGELTDEQFDKLFDIYQTKMPYGTQKARTGDPYDFILEELALLENRTITKEKEN